MIQLIQTPDQDPSSLTLPDTVSSSHHQDPSVEMSHQLEKKRVPDFVEDIQKGMFNK